MRWYTLYLHFQLYVIIAYCNRCDSNPKNATPSERIEPKILPNTKSIEVIKSSSSSMIAGARPINRILKLIRKKRPAEIENIANNNFRLDRNSRLKYPSSVIGINNQQLKMYDILRGGALPKKKEKKDDNDDEKTQKKSKNVSDLESTDNNIVDDSDDDEEGVDEEGEFPDRNERGQQMLSSVSGIWNKTPPMTQAYIASSVALTLLAFGLNKNNWPSILDFDLKSLLTLQVWRLFTPFLYIGKLDLYYPLTLQFVWQHMSQLEKMNYNKPEEFLVMLLFGGFALVTIYSILGISTKFLGHNLGAYLVYIWARVFEGMDVNFMDLFTLKAEMLPWFFCAQSLVLDGQFPFADLLGIVAGHLYYYLQGKQIVRAPQFLKDLFNKEDVKKRYAKFKDDFE
eukprot:gene11578-15505_t